MKDASGVETTGRGIAREHLQGRPGDPTGQDAATVDSRTQNDQQMPSGEEGLEGGAAGKFTRPFREGGEPARPETEAVRENRKQKS